jgi:hypothetical protein
MIKQPIFPPIVDLGNVIVIVMKGNAKHYKDAVIYHNLSGIRTRNASGDRHWLLK